LKITLIPVRPPEDPVYEPVCVGGRGDSPVEDWYPGCGEGPTPFDVAEINRRFAQVANEEPTGGWNG
jgi:hypothetical protein